MGMLTNQIKVLLQRVKMAGREPYRLVMHQGLKEALRTEQEGKIKRRAALYGGRDLRFDKVQTDQVEFDGLPVYVDNSVGEILVQVKPRPMAEDEPVKVDWKKVNRIKRV